MDDSVEMTISVPSELMKRMEELQEELEMDPSEMMKEALKYYIDLMDIDDALANDPFSQEESGESLDDPYDIESYDLPPLIDEEGVDEYPDYG